MLLTHRRAYAAASVNMKVKSRYNETTRRRQNCSHGPCMVHRAYCTSKSVSVSVGLRVRAYGPSLNVRFIGRRAVRAVFINRKSSFDPQPICKPTTYRN